MLIPIVPVVPHTTVINKTIEYSDTVLPLNDSGKDLQVNSISNVSEYSLEECLKKIFESNPDIIFNTIQYSRKDNKVYFYTDKKISTKAWDESRVREYKPISNRDEIIEEITNLLAQEKPTETDCISLYDIAEVYKKYNKAFDTLVEKNVDYIERKLKEKMYDSTIVFYQFDFDKKQLEIGLKYVRNYDKIVLTKQDGDLYIVESESLYSQELLSYAGNDLSDFYDQLLKFYDIKKQNSYGKNSINSNFKVELSSYGVTIYVHPTSGFGSLCSDFSISSHSYSDIYKYDCNSTLILNTTQGNEDDIFKSIFIRIDDCPECIKSELYQIRQKQLKENSRESGKKLELKRGFLSWLIEKTSKI